MKAFAIICVCSVSLISAAFDPAEPPLKRSIEGTIDHVSKTILPLVSLKDATLDEALEFLTIGSGKPPAYQIRVQAVRLKADPRIRISMDAKDISIIQAVARIAQMVDANILIEPGCIKLVSKEK